MRIYHVEEKPASNWKTSKKILATRTPIRQPQAFLNLENPWKIRSTIGRKYIREIPPQKVALPKETWDFPRILKKELIWINSPATIIQHVWKNHKRNITKNELVRTNGNLKILGCKIGTRTLTHLRKNEKYTLIGPFNKSWRWPDCPLKSLGQNTAINIIEKMVALKWSEWQNNITGTLCANYSEEAKTT